MMQSPAALKVTTAPVREQTQLLMGSMLIATGKPEVAVAVGVYVPPTFTGDGFGDVNEIVWPRFNTPPVAPAEEPAATAITTDITTRVATRRSIFLVVVPRVSISVLPSLDGCQRATARRVLPVRWHASTGCAMTRVSGAGVTAARHPRRRASTTCRGRRRRRPRPVSGARAAGSRSLRSA